MHWMRGGISLAATLLACCVLPGPAAAESRTLTMRFGPVDMHGYETRSGGDRVRSPQIDGFVTPGSSTRAAARSPSSG
jgi:hypothetical protein